MVGHLSHKPQSNVPGALGSQCLLSFWRDRGSVLGNDFVRAMADGVSKGFPMLSKPRRGKSYDESGEVRQLVAPVEL